MPNISKEEQEACRESITKAMDLLMPAVSELRAAGFKAEAEANETEETVTITVVVHQKWKK